MDTKVQNIVLKSITGLIIFLGVLFTVMVMGDDNPAEIPEETPQERAAADSGALKAAINASLANIDANLRMLDDLNDPTQEATKTALKANRDELFNLRTLPGTYDALNQECLRINTAVNDILSYDFRFEAI